VKKIVAVIIALLAMGGWIISMQNSRQITFGWEPMPAEEKWQAVRLYDISSTPEAMLGFAPCTPGPPIVCPTSLTLTVIKKGYRIVARSWNGDLESGDSNIVVIPGPPLAPTGLKR
jgi:hypothetical protein